jgi:hypothetical protein
MHITPFYSDFLGLAVEPLWHDSDECEIGQHIPLAERRASIDHILKHCPFCRLLNEPSKRVPPTSKRRVTDGVIFHLKDHS